MNRAFGKLYLIPSALSEANARQYLAPETIVVLNGLTHFVVERAKTARHFLKSIDYPHHFDEVEMIELDKHEHDDTDLMLAACLRGKNVGLLSEAGVPGVADPGGVIVNAAHEKGIEVCPLIGPSSILLALMASGMNGQRFSFHGYLPRKEHELAKALKNLETESRRENCSQIFIETPYRNDKMVQNLLKSLHPNTQLCIASNINTPTQFIKTKPISIWKKTKVDLQKNPTVFVLFSGVLSSKK